MSLSFVCTSAQLFLLMPFFPAQDKFAGKWKILEAANLVYHEFWGNDLGTLLQPVPDCRNFEYLTKEVVISLHLSKLLYPGTTLLVHTEYEAVYNDLQQYNVLSESKGGVVVMGQPGIGTCPLLAVTFFNINQVQRKIMLPVLSPVSPPKLEEDCRSSSKWAICSLWRHWCFAIRLFC